MQEFEFFVESVRKVVVQAENQQQAMQILSQQLNLQLNQPTKITEPVYVEV